MKSRELENLIQDYLDGSLTEDKLEPLQHELRHNPEARDLYRDFVHLQNAIQLQALSPDPLSQNVIPIDRIILRQKRRNFRIALISAAALLMISLVVMRLFFVDPAQPATLAFETSPGTQFTISHDESAEAPLGQMLVPGSRLQIKQGSVQLDFSNGVQSIVVAPADLTLHDEDQLHLRLGTARFHVPQGAEGFTVDTPDLHIVDLGTEFGVKADPGQHDEVHVMKGKVQVTAKRLRKESTTLGKGEARRIDPVGRLHAIATRDAAFPSQLPKTLPYLHWSFDQDLQASGTHPLASQILTSGNVQSIPGKHGKAMRTTVGGQAFLQTDWPGFLGQHPRSISLWFRLNHPAKLKDQISSMVHWGDAVTHDNAKWKIGVLNAKVPDATVVRLSFGSDWYNAHKDIADGQWHHCLAVFRGINPEDNTPDIDLFIDGERQQLHHFGYPEARLAKNNLHSEIKTRAASPLSIGGDSGTDRATIFPGDIDEVIIFDGAFPEDQLPELLNGSLVPSP